MKMGDSKYKAPCVASITKCVLKILSLFKQEVYLPSCVVVSLKWDKESRRAPRFTINIITVKTPNNKENI